LLLLVLLLAINYCLCHEIYENMGEGLTTGVNDPGNNLSPVTVTPAMIYRNCQINTKLRISLRIFIKIKIRPNGTLRGRVVDPYSFFTDPDPELDVGGQYGSGSNTDPGL
jgi:hypothetical protein